MRAGAMIKVGEFTYGHELIEVKSWGEGARLQIGKYCSIAENVTVFLGGNHNSHWVSTYPFGHINQEVLGDEKFQGHPSSNGDVWIGSDVWIGYGSTLMSGVEIGSGAVIAANSHVVQDVPNYEVWGGNPARFIKKRFSQNFTDRLIKLSWWDFPIEKVLLIRSLLSSNLTEESLLEIEAILSH
jgi:acetyltransferase-like isoleucine patch superfamily enzyme